jgi:hypothetical protein
MPSAPCAVEINTGILRAQSRNFVVETCATVPVFNCFLKNYRWAVFACQGEFVIGEFVIVNCKLPFPVKADMGKM